MKDIQEAFDVVCEHLLTQKERSTNLEGECMYRGIHGRKCALGALISDESYNYELEGYGPYNTEVDKALQESGYPVQCELYGDLQYIHDGHALTGWQGSLQDLALLHGLEFNYEGEQWAIK